jgi:hypothetical protein
MEAVSERKRAAVRRAIRFFKEFLLCAVAMVRFFVVAGAARVRERSKAILSIEWGRAKWEAANHELVRGLKSESQRTWRNRENAEIGGGRG